jgi:hypothetical protein
MKILTRFFYYKILTKKIWDHQKDEEPNPVIAENWHLS